MADQTVLDPTTGELVPKYQDGRERMDPNPVSATLRFKREPSYFEQMRAQIRQELSEAAAAQEYETFDEANDFAIGEDFEPSSPFEEEFGPDGLSQYERLDALIYTEQAPASKNESQGAEEPTQAPQKGDSPPAEPSAKQKAVPDGE